MAIDSNIREFISNNGYIKIDDLMKQVLSLHSSSYYRAQKNIGASGDFITAPEISQLFGEIIALWIIKKWQNIGSPKEFSLVELGPGQGILMRDILRVSKIVPEFLQNVNIFFLEINPNFIKKQKRNLAPHVQKLHWLERIQDIPKTPTIFIANEFLDALPIKQYLKVKETWHEITLIADPLDGKLKFDKISINQNLQKQLLTEHSNANDGAIIEESLESLEIISFIAKHTQNHTGHSLIIDYGYNIPSSIRNRSQYNSTLQAIKDHNYQSIIPTLGAADLTAHVDFHALQKTALTHGIRNCNISTQREFLLKYGIQLRLQSLKNNLNDDKQSFILDRQVQRLISTNQMGNLFKTIELW